MPKTRIQATEIILSFYVFSYKYGSWVVCGFYITIVLPCFRHTKMRTNAADNEYSTFIRALKFKLRHVKLILLFNSKDIKMHFFLWFLSFKNLWFFLFWWTTLKIKEIIKDLRQNNVSVFVIKFSLWKNSDVLQSTSQSKISHHSVVWGLNDLHN